MRVLLLATTTGYQTRAFGEAAERLGIDLVFATDRCDMLDDPWQDRALAIRFYDEAASVSTILEAAQQSPLDAVVAVGDRPTVIAGRVRTALGFPGHSADATRVARNKRLARERFKVSGLPAPLFIEGALDSAPDQFAPLGFPLVVKPLALSGSRGVIRVNNVAELSEALARIRTLLESPDVRAERDQAHEGILAEQFIEGREFAVEGLMNHGTLDVLAIFDKPDPLDGPFFEETIYITPSSTPQTTQSAIVSAIATASRALGLSHGPIHAECRVNRAGVYVLEVAARPIGGLCARALRFVRRPSFNDPHAPVRNNLIPISTIGREISFEEVLLRHAVGEESTAWRRERSASGVMMIPIPRRGILRSVSGLDEARAVPAIVDVRITAKPDQLLVPLPEGASYLGFIFARGDRPGDVDLALRTAHSRLTFNIASEVRVLQSLHG